MSAMFLPLTDVVKKHVENIRNRSYALNLCPAFVSFLGPSFVSNFDKLRSKMKSNRS